MLALAMLASDWQVWLGTKTQVIWSEHESRIFIYNIHAPAGHCRQVAEVLMQDYEGGIILHQSQPQNSY